MNPTCTPGGRYCEQAYPNTFNLTHFADNSAQNIHVDNFWRNRTVDELREDYKTKCQVI